MASVSQMSEVRGIPLLSGPPPSMESSEACRKCNKEFNMFLNRSRKCNHCGYSYCHSCTDYQALMPRAGQETGYNTMNVCAFCIEFLSITAAGKGLLRSMPLSKLKKYVDAYDIKITRAVEKDDLIDAILAARTGNGCLPPGNENYYRRYSVPDRTSGTRPRGLFSRSNHHSNPPPPPPSNQQESYDFPRPDLAPDSPPRQHHQHPTGPPPPPRPHTQRPTYNREYTSPPLPQTPPTPPHYHPSYSQYNAPPPVPPRPYQQQRQPPPPPPHTSRPQHQAYPSYQRPSASQSSENLQPNTRRTPPRPRAASATPPVTAPPPTLDELLEVPPEAIGSLSIGALKAVLFTNHVNAGLILEKSELVLKVQNLVEDERRDRQRQRALEEQEEADRIERQRVLLEEHKKAQREKEETAKAEQKGDVESEGDGGEDGSGGMSSSTPPPPPRTRGTAADLERTGLCVICQDDEANIAIVDCGHLAMCRGCSDLIMASSRECPLCRTRIVTEARLLRIFKT